MDPWPRSPRLACSCFPRRRGDGPSLQHEGHESGRFPPQARGWTLGRESIGGVHVVSPAGAGMDRFEVRHGWHLFRFPRRRGDGPIAFPTGIKVTLFPPQARGWTAVGGFAYRGDGVSPRRRGDGPVDVCRYRCENAFPPQARGWTQSEAREDAKQKVSPAGAGMDRYPTGWSPLPERFPRRRGDGPSFATIAMPWCRFPPQARGWTQQGGESAVSGKVSPAGAGMDPEQRGVSQRGQSFPRRRGDGPAFRNPNDATQMFPPAGAGMDR